MIRIYSACMLTYDDSYSYVAVCVCVPSTTRHFPQRKKHGFRPMCKEAKSPAAIAHARRIEKSSRVWLWRRQQRRERASAAAVGSPSDVHPPASSRRRRAGAAGPRLTVASGSASPPLDHRVGPSVLYFYLFFSLVYQLLPFLSFVDSFLFYTQHRPANPQIAR
jgi:hypothetical protein